jgi:hypothetical protein
MELGDVCDRRLAGLLMLEATADPVGIVPVGMGAFELHTGQIELDSGLIPCADGCDRNAFAIAALAVSVTFMPPAPLRFAFAPAAATSRPQSLG